MKTSVRAAALLLLGLVLGCGETTAVAPDAGEAVDAGTRDAGAAVDTGARDAGGPPDTGTRDAGPAPVDLGPPDLGPPEPDLGPPDLGAPDAGPVCGDGLSTRPRCVIAAR